MRLRIERNESGELEPDRAAGVPAAGGSCSGLAAVAGGSFLPALLLEALLVQLLLALQFLGPLLLLAVDFFLLMEALLVQLAFLPLDPLLLLYVSALLQFLPLFLRWVSDLFLSCSSFLWFFSC